MSLNWLSLSRLSITTRLLLWFLAISLIPCSILTIVTNYLSVRSLERSVRNQLVSIFQIYSGLTEPAVFIAHPILKEGVVIGVVVVQIGNKALYRVFNDYDGLGETGETLVSVRRGDEVIFVAPLRHDPEAAFRRRVKLGENRATGMQLAVKGQQGYGQAIDYRGVTIMGAWTYVPSFRWGLMVKQDRDEAFAMVNQQRMAIGLLMMLTVVAVAWVAWWVARSITQPIRDAALVAD